jgi:hypothetical protein
MTTPTDRAAGPRGGPEQQAWPEPTPAGGRRLPAARRERKPVLAVLAVLLIALGAVGSYYLVTKNARLVTAVQIGQLVPAGQEIPAGALRPVQMPASTQAGYVPWSEASEVTRYYAAATLEPGTLLIPAMTTRTSQSLKGKATIGLALKEGQLPDSLKPGDLVNIYEDADSNDGCLPGTPGATLATYAIVTAVARPGADSGSDSTDVQVAISPKSAANVTCSAANGIAAIAIVGTAGQQTGSG